MKITLLLIGLLAFTAPKEGVIKTFKTNAAASEMSILGTSTLHDWEMKAVDLKGTMNVDLYADSLDIKNLKLTVPVEALKSGKGPMDRNAYKALKYKSHQNIHYQLISIKEVSKTDANAFHAVSRGKLEVAGKERILNIPITVKVLSNGGMILSGSTTFKMSSFDVEAPSFMMGAVTTGDEITINFSINYN